MIFDLEETRAILRMIETEHLDIRTVTLGISLRGCATSDITETSRRVYEHIMRSAERLVPVAKEVNAAYGVPIVNKRISVTPIALVGEPTGAASYVPLANALDRAAEELGIDYIAGFSGSAAVSRAYRSLLGTALLLALVVVSLGAYVRLSDAGLGCPDWPGCYGQLIGVPEQAHDIHAAQSAFPGKPIEAPKAWKEMIHRYAAGTLGLAIAALAWRSRARRKPWLEIALVGVVLIQALLGMLTVTKLLKPVIVTSHLLGGMTTLALLALLWLREKQPGRQPVISAKRPRQLSY